MPYLGCFSNLFGSVGILGGVSMFLIGIFWLAVIVFIIWAIWKYSKGSGIATVLSRDALEIVKERYAKGEISKKEFEEMKKELHKK